MALIKKTEGGFDLVVNEATFAEVTELKKAMQEQLRTIDYSLSDFSDVTTAIKSMIDFLLSMDTSVRVETAIFNCLKHCTFDGIQITPQLFDDKPEARSDYYEIVKDCVEVNLRPFMKSLSSQFPILTVFAEVYQSMLTEQNGNSK